MVIITYFIYVCIIVYLLIIIILYYIEPLDLNFWTLKELRKATQEFKMMGTMKQEFG